MRQLEAKHLLFLAPTVMVCSGAHAVDYLTAAQAQKILFAQADEFKERPTKLSDEELAKIKELSGVRQRIKEPKIWQVMQKGKPMGFFFVDEVVGKHEFITYATAISNEGKVMGIEIMSYRETHGHEVRETSWRKHFAGKTLTDAFKLDVDVPNISGATLSCRNVLDGVKRMLALYKVIVDA